MVATVCVRPILVQAQITILVHTGGRTTVYFSTCDNNAVYLEKHSDQDVCATDRSWNSYSKNSINTRS